MIIRIPLTDDNHVIRPISLEVSGGSVEKAPAALPDVLADFSLPEASFVLTPTNLRDYESSRYSHPVADVNVTVPDADLPLVTSWFGNASSSGGAASDTLVKRMTDSVTGAIERFFTDAGQSGIFTRPFRVGVALRLATGKQVCLSEPRLMLPNNSAPLMLIRESRLTGNSLQTLTEIVNTPMSLMASLPAFPLPDGAAELVTHLDFFATKQVDMLRGDETVNGVRSYSYFGESLPMWNYSRLGENTLREAAMADSAFRVIASIPIAEAVEGIDSVALPLDLRNLENWKNFPAVEELTGSSGGSGGGADPDNPNDPDNPKDPLDPDDPSGIDIPHTHVCLTTVPLDLGMPEKAKRIRALSVRGIFQRNLISIGPSFAVPVADTGVEDQKSIARDGVEKTAAGKTGEIEKAVAEKTGEIEVILYGSHHRERWHRIATARGPHIRFMRGVKYRWLMVRITAPRESVFDALTFTVK